MLKRFIAGAAIAAAWIATGASAECPAASYGSGVVHALNPTNKADVDLILSMSLMPKMLHISYDKEKGSKLPCELTRFDAASTTYQLAGSPVGSANARIAVPQNKNQPIAELVPITNIIETIEASKQGKTAPIRGYMLMTVSKADIIGWLLYTDVPNQQTLVADITSALGGTIKPVFKTDNASGKSSIYMPS